MCLTSHCQEKPELQQNSELSHSKGHTDNSVAVVHDVFFIEKGVVVLIY
jgi:hypothetical protein